MSVNLRDKIRGMFLGVAIGDALGMPVEGYNAARIEEFADKQGKNRIMEYYANPDHKWFKDRKPGTWTDDTQLTLAVAEGIIEAKMDLGVYDDKVMDAIAKAHVTSLEKLGDKGFGGTTREAIKAIKEGKSWRESAPTNPALGYGNGVVMKLSPIAAVKAALGYRRGCYDLTMMLTNMTHNRETARIGSGAMLEAMTYCLRVEKDNFSLIDFIKVTGRGAAEAWTNVAALEGAYNILSRIWRLPNYRAYNQGRIIEEFGGGSVAVYDSLPFSLMYFVQNPFTIDCVYDVLMAGGDTDSTGSMVASLLGALHGEKAFQHDPHLIAGLDQKEYILDVADRFCDAIGWHKEDSL